MIEACRIESIDEKLDHGAFCRSRSSHRDHTFNKPTTSKLQASIGQGMGVVGMK